MIQKIREKLNIQTIIRVVPTALFMLFIFSVMIFTYTGKVKKAVTDTKLSIESLEKLSNSFEGTLQDNIYDKNNYIDINGLATRILGINSLNERQKLTNGHLTGIQDTVDISRSSISVIEFNDFLKERGIDFLYLLAPSKLAFYDESFAPGYSSRMKDAFDSMIKALDDEGVTTLYMNTWYQKNNWSMDDVYYKTDHHWNPNGALGAARATMELFYDLGWVDFYRKDLLEQDSYNIITLKDWFLGSSGKRVGIYFAGVDDLDVYFPDFDTDYAYSGLNPGTTDWEYADSPLDLSYMEERDWYGSNPYRTYLYDASPLQRVTNAKAPNDKRVLIIGDSFRKAWEYFLTSQFKDIYSLDLRHYTDGTTAEFIAEFQPDIVIMCNSTPGYNAEYRQNIDRYLVALQATPLTNTQVDILSEAVITAQEDNDNNFIVMCDNLEPNQAYTLTLDSTTYDGGDEWYVQMTLQNLSSNKAVYNRYFDANSNEMQKWIFTTPEDITGEYSIYLYAGTKGHTKEVSASVSGVTLRRGIFED